MRNLLYAVSIIIALLCSCHRDPVWQTLDVAESIMEEFPDSALALLSSLDGKTLKGETLARYALLLSQAYDKNYIDVTDDSLISIATDFFDQKDDSREKLKANFYRAIIYVNSTELERALKYALRAERIANTLGTSADLSQVQSLLSYIYSATFNNKKALEYAEADLHNAKLSGRSEWVNKAYITVTKRLINIGNYTQAITYIDTLCQNSTVDESTVSDLSILSHAGLYNYIAIDSIYREAKNKGLQLTPTTIAYAAWANYVLDHKKEAGDLLEFIQNSELSPTDSIELLRVKYDIAITEHNTDEAITYRQSLSAYTDSILISLANNSIHLIQVDYEQDQTQSTIIRHNLERNRLLVIVAILLLTIIILSLSILLYRTNMHKKIAQAEYELLLLHRERDNLNNDIERLNISIHNNSETISQLQENIYTLSKSEEHNLATIDQLRNNITESIRQTKLAFINQFSWIENQGMLYIDVCHQDKAAEIAYNRLKSTLDKVRSKPFRKNLENIINRHRDNLMLRLRDCNKLVESERILILYLCAGLSLKVITCILKKDGNSLYNQKHRIKGKLEEFYPDLLEEMRDIFA